MPVEIPSMSIMLHRSWWVLLLRGAAAIIFGVLTWMQPAASAAALVPCQPTVIRESAVEMATCRA